MKSLPDESTRRDPIALYNFIDQDIARKVAGNATLAKTLAGLNEKDFAYVVRAARSKYTVNPSFSVINPDGSTRQLKSKAAEKQFDAWNRFSKLEYVDEEQKRQIAEDAFMADMVAAKNGDILENGKVREYKVDEAKKNAFFADFIQKNGLKNVADIDPKVRKEVAEIAENQNPEVAAYFKYNPKYLKYRDEERQKYLQEAREHRKWKNESILGVPAEFAEQFAWNLALNPLNKLSQMESRWRDGVPYDNPKGLTDRQIREIAREDAWRETMRYNVEDEEGNPDTGKGDSLMRKAAGFLGGLAGFGIGPGGRLMEAGFKGVTAAGGKLASLGAKLGSTAGLPAAGGKFAAVAANANAAKAGAAKALEKTGAFLAGKSAPSTVLKGGLGAAAAVPYEAYNPPSVGQPYSTGDYLAGVAEAVPESVLYGAAFTAGAKAVGEALKRAANTPYNPMWKNTKDTTGLDALGRYIHMLNERIQNGAPVSDGERKFFGFVMDEALATGVDPVKIVTGEIAPRFRQQQLRGWVKDIPVLRRLFDADKRTFWTFEKTNNKYVGGEYTGETFDAGAFKKAAEDALRKNVYPQNAFGGLLEENALPALAPQYGTPSRRELAEKKLAQNRSAKPVNRIPFYVDGPTAQAQADLFGEDIPSARQSFLDSAGRVIPTLKVPVKMLKLSKDVPNFKADADPETGVVEGQGLSGRFQRAGTAPIVVWERKNGDLEVITGRHRLDLARRSGELTIPAQILKESDGFGVEDARTFDAESNIRDGMGTVRDYAHFFRLKPDMQEADAAARGLIAREKGKKGWDIGRNAVQEVYDLYANGKLAEDKAAAIAGGAPKNRDVQLAALNKRRAMTAQELGLFARNLDLRYKFDGTAFMGGNGAKQMDLFASDSPWMVEMEKISKAQAALIAQNLEKIRAVKGAVNRPEAAKALGVDVKDPESVRGAMQDLLVENLRIANPDPQMLERIREKAGLDGKNKDALLNPASADMDSGGETPMNPMAEDLFDEYMRGAADSDEALARANGATEKEIAAFKREFNAVFEKYYGSSLYMKAPNGNDTRLDEPLWIAVRTPTFKKWFGDWEKLAEAYPENEIFDIDEAYKFVRKNLQGGSFTSKDGYGATLGREGIDKMNSGLARGKTANNRLHALAFANIGKLFGNSELLETEPPRDGNTNIKQYLKFYAPLYMDGLYAVKITVKELNGNNGNRLYSIEGLDITKESEYRGQSRGSKENSIPADYSDSVSNFVKKLREVKGNVSKVVDENGEPLVVYHGTRAVSRFSVFKGSEHFFTDNREVADGFLNGNDFVLEINGDKYPVSRRDLEAIASVVFGDSSDFKNLVGDFEAGELSYEGASEILSDITHNEYTVEALADFPLSIKEGGRIVEAFLNIRNPVEIDYGGKTWQAGKVMPERDLENNKAADGLIGKNIREGGLMGELRNGEDFPISTDYVVRDSTQIKSAYGNAKFNPNDADIYREPSGSGANVADATNAANGEGGISKGDSRYVAERFDATPRPEGWSKEEADKAFDDLWNALGGDGRLTAAEMRKLEGKIDAFTKKIDPRMIELPEVLEMAERITNKRVKVVRGFPFDALGVYSLKDKSIRLRTDLFKLVTQFDEWRIAQEAALDALRQSGLTETFLAEWAKTPEQRAGLLKQKELEVRFKRIFEERVNSLRTQRKKSGFSPMALAVAYHELMHAVDDSGEGRLKRRGNTLGHIAGGVEHMMKSAIPVFENADGEFPDKQRRYQIRKTAMKLAGPRPKGKEALDAWSKRAAENYERLLDDYLERNGLLGLRMARKELKRVLAFWHGVDEDKIMPYYTNSPEELYAEAGACFLANPVKFKALAPNVYKTMIARMRDKSEFWFKWQEFQMRLSDPKINVKERESRVLEGMKSAEEAKALAQKDLEEAVRIAKKDSLKTLYRSEYAVIYDIAESLAKRTGIDKRELLAPLNDYRYSMSYEEGYLSKLLMKVGRPLVENNLSLDDLNMFMLYKRIYNERFDLANPLGLQARQAREGMKYKLLGLDLPRRLEFLRLEKVYRDLRREMVLKPFVAGGFLDAETAKKILDNRSYATFHTHDLPGGDYIETLLKKRYGDGLGSVIGKQFGTLSPVKGVFGETLRKDLQILNFIKKQNALRMVVDVLTAESPQYIRVANYKKNEKGFLEPVIEDTKDVKTILLLKNGRLEGYYVPRAIYMGFENAASDSTAIIRGAVRATTALKKVYVQFNPAIWASLHVRDLQKMFRAFPGGAKAIPRLSALAPKAWKAALSGFRGRPNDLLIEALDRGMLIGRRDHFGMNSTHDVDNFEQLLDEFGLMLKGRRPFTDRAFHALAEFGQVFERATKIAGMLYLDEYFPEKSEAEKQWWVRTQAGSPDFNDRINRNWLKIAELYSVFTNARVQGARADWQLMEEVGKWQYVLGLIKWALPAFAARLLKAMVNSPWFALRLAPIVGLPGATMVALYNNIPSYDKQNYIVLPLFADENGKTVYLRIPNEDFEKYFVATLQKALDGEELASFDNLLAEFGPSNPMAELLAAWGLYLGGVMPRNFKGQPIMDETLFKAGGGERLKKMVEHTWNVLLGSNTYRFKTRDGKLGEITPSDLERVLSLPVVQPLISRWLKVSDKGYYDEVNRQAKVLDRAKAKKALLKREAAARIYNGEEYNAVMADLGLGYDDATGVNRLLKEARRRAKGEILRAGVNALEMQAIEADMALRGFKKPAAIKGE